MSMTIYSFMENCSRTYWSLYLGMVSLEGKPLDVLILSSTDGDNEFLENSFLERFAPACILVAGKKNSLYLKKDGSAEKRGIHTLHLESGDIVLYSGFHKKNSNVSQGDDTVGADGQYAITELSS